ncbi:hypothetical protein AB0H34_36850 [Saccharopolyspora shandongensis]
MIIEEAGEGLRVAGPYSDTSSCGNPAERWFGDSFGGHAAKGVRIDR